MSENDQSFPALKSNPMSAWEEGQLKVYAAQALLLNMISFAVFFAVFGGFPLLAVLALRNWW